MAWDVFVPGCFVLHSGQAIMVVFPDTMYTFRDTRGGGGGGGGGGGVKIDNFFSYLTFVTASS